jgi:hypothetical protein
LVLVLGRKLLMLSLDSEEETEVAVFAMEASEGYCTFMKMASPEGMDLNISPPTCLTPVTKDMSPCFFLKDRVCKHFHPSGLLISPSVPNYKIF